eukprot:COSAG02_NODE_6076_length_3817_cov_1.652501_9_plen_51_part_00
MGGGMGTVAQLLTVVLPLALTVSHAILFDAQECEACKGSKGCRGCRGCSQ